MTGHECSAFPKRRREVGVEWKCPYCGKRWTLVEQRDEQWQDTFVSWVEA